MKKDEDLKKQVELTLDGIESLINNNLKELASFDNRSLMLRQHKNLIFAIKKSLLKIFPDLKISKGDKLKLNLGVGDSSFLKKTIFRTEKDVRGVTKITPLEGEEIKRLQNEYGKEHSAVDDCKENKEKVINKCQELLSFLEKFEAHIRVKDVHLKTFKEKELSLLHENMDDLEGSWKSIYSMQKKQLQNKKGVDNVAKIISDVFHLEKEDFRDVQSFYEELGTEFHDILEYQIKSLHEEKRYTKELIDNLTNKEKWIDRDKITKILSSLDFFKGELINFLKKEEAIVHTPLRKLLGNIHSSKRKALKILEDKDNIDLEDIRDHLYSLSRPEDFTDYYLTLIKPLGLELNDEIKNVLIKNGVKLPNEGIQRLFNFLKFKKIGETRDHHGKEVQKARMLSRKDDLTGLNTIRVLREYGKNIFMRKLDSNYTISLIFIDIDDFKTINDDHSHGLGNECLKLLGNIMEKTKGSDIPIRWGGDEFCLVLPNTNIDAAVKIAERISKEIKKETSVDEGRFGPINFITLSMGIVNFPHDLSLIDENNAIIKLKKLLDSNNKNKDVDAIKDHIKLLWTNFINLADSREMFAKREKESDKNNGIERNSRIETKRSVKIRKDRLKSNQF